MLVKFIMIARVYSFTENLCGLFTGKIAEFFMVD
jgi:hypothetical protein